MAQEKEIISAVNNLIETLKDGQEGFRQAADAVKDSNLKSLFSGYSQQRSRFANELQNQARSFGESKPEKSSSAAGAMHPDPKVRNPDYLAEKFVDEAFIEVVAGDVEFDGQAESNAGKGTDRHTD